VRVRWGWRIGTVFGIGCSGLGMAVSHQSFPQRCLNGILNLAVVLKERHVDLPIAFPSWDIGWDKESPQAVEKPT
jgi:hypothetical protein